MILRYLLYLYYYQCIKHRIKRGYWNNYSSILGILGYNSGLSVLLEEIESGYFLAKNLEIAKREKLIKEAFKIILDYFEDHYYDHEMLINFLKKYPQYALSKINKDHDIEQKILSLKDYVLNSTHYNDLSDEIKNIFQKSGNEDHLYTVGGKNSAPMDLVEEMYKIQAKGCPVPPKNNN